MRERNPPGVFARTRFGFLSNVPKCPLGKHACTRSLGHLFLFSVLRWLVQHASILPAACCNLLRSVQQSSPQHTAIFHIAYSYLHTTYCNSLHCVLQFFHTAYRNSSHSIPQSSAQRAAILHAAYRNSSHSVLQSSPQHTAISSATYRNLRLQPSDGHPKASDGHPKASYVHPKAANGDLSYYPDTFL